MNQITDQNEHNTVTCILCNAKFTRMTHTHLKHKHQLTLSEYSTKFPTAKMVSDELRERLATNTEEFWIKQHGKVDGLLKYAEYVKMLADKNTFEAKRKKHGWTKAQFKEYNLSRGHTLENDIKRHGVELGTKKYNDYVDVQRKAGVTLEWFIEKHGDVEGKRVWANVLKSKLNTRESFIQRHGESEGNIRYNKFKFRSIGVSAIEKQFVDTVKSLEECKSEWTMHCYNTEQYTFQSPGHNYLGDLVITPINVCIEFHGDYWHCNPRRYKEDYYHIHYNKTASEVWDKDARKQRTIEEAGFKYLVIWEYDWKRDKSGCIERIKECLIQK